MLVSPTNPVGIKLYSYAKLSLLFCFKNMLIDHVSENTLLKEKENKMKFLLISLQMDYDSLVLGPVTVHTSPHL